MLVSPWYRPLGAIGGIPEAELKLPLLRRLLLLPRLQALRGISVGVGGALFVVLVADGGPGE